MSEEKETLESLFGELEHTIEDLKSQISDAQYEVDEAYSKVDYAKDYINGCDSKLDEVETLVNELRNRTGEFASAKTKRELIDILIAQENLLLKNTIELLADMDIEFYLINIWYIPRYDTWDSRGFCKKKS